MECYFIAILKKSKENKEMEDTDGTYWETLMFHDEEMYHRRMEILICGGKKFMCFKGKCILDAT